MSMKPALAAQLRNKLEARTARVGVVGLGYVGLPLAVEFGLGGLTAVGIDLDQRKVDAITRGESYIPDVPTHDVADAGATGQAPRDDRLLASLRRSIRSTSACRRRCARPRTPTCPTSSLPSRRSLSICSRACSSSSSRPPIRERPKNWCSRFWRQRGFTRRRRFLPRVLARARRSRQRHVHDAQRPEGCRRNNAGVQRTGGGAVLDCRSIRLSR